jgi:hypothetical protein
MRGVRVVRERRGRGALVARKRGVCLHRLAVRRVQLDPLGRQHVVVDGVADERVAERVARVVDDQEVVLGRLPQRIEQRGPRERSHGGQQPVGHPPAGDRGDAQDALRRLTEQLGAREKHVAQRWR